MDLAERANPVKFLVAAEDTKVIKTPHQSTACQRHLRARQRHVAASASTGRSLTAAAIWRPCSPSARALQRAPSAPPSPSTRALRARHQPCADQRFRPYQATKNRSPGRPHPRRRPRSVTAQIRQIAKGRPRGAEVAATSMTVLKVRPARETSPAVAQGGWRSGRTIRIRLSGIRRS